MICQSRITGLAMEEANEGVTMQSILIGAVALILVALAGYAAWRLAGLVAWCVAVTLSAESASDCFEEV